MTDSRLAVDSSDFVEMDRFLAVLLVLAGTVGYGGGEEIFFANEGHVAVPAVYGYLVFRIDAADFRQLYAEPAKKVLTNFKRLVTFYHTPPGCLGLRRDHFADCSLVASAKSWDSETTELESVVTAIESVVEGGITFAFVSSSSDGDSSRGPRSFILLALGGFFASIGLGVKNRVDLMALTERIGAVEDHDRHLIRVVEGLSKSELRNRHMLEKVIRQEEK
jgi:hypothetical protein